MPTKQPHAGTKRARPAKATFEEALRGIDAWAQLPRDGNPYGLGLTPEEVATWEPTITQLYIAHGAGFTLSYSTLKRYATQRSAEQPIDAIRTALRANRETDAAKAFANRFGLAKPAPTADDRSFAR